MVHAVRTSQEGAPDCSQCKLQPILKTNWEPSGSAAVDKNLRELAKMGSVYGRLNFSGN